MKPWIINLGFFCITLLVFGLGIYTGANRTFPYNMLRNLADKVRPYSPKLNSHKVGIVLFGDSLGARGNWGAISQSEHYELLVLARGGLRAARFPYDPNDYAGSIHVYWLGTNDLLSEIDVQGALVGLEKMALKSELREKKVIIMGVPKPLIASELTQIGFAEYNLALQRLCSKKGWFYMDVEALLENEYPRRQLSTHDGVHLTLEASNLITRELYRSCQTLIN